VTPLDSPFRSHSSHRESLRQDLLLAVQRRDGDTVTRLSLRWVHRQGVGTLDPLIGSLGDAEASNWWRDQLLADRPIGTLASPSDPAVEAAGAPPAVAVVPMAEIPKATAPEPIDQETAPSSESLTLTQLLASLDSRIVSDTTASPEPPQAVGASAAEEDPEEPASEIASAPAAAFEAPEMAPEVALETAPAMASSSKEDDQRPEAETAPPVRSGRLARLRHLVRDCFEEVAQTFQAVIEGDAPTALEADAFTAADSAAEQPRATPAVSSPNVALTGSLTPPPLVPTAPATPAAVNIPPLSLTPRSSPRSGRPAPAPAAHPGLERLRSWLPDEDNEQQRRAS